MTIQLLWLFASFVFISAVALPIVYPRFIRHLFYKVNIPFFCIVGIGIVFNPPSPSFQDHQALQTAYAAYAIYTLISLFLIVFSQSSKRDSLSLDTHRVKFSLDEKKFLRRIFFFLCSSTIFLTLPFWLQQGFTNTGLFSLIFDPVHHLMLRESSLKLAERTIAMRLYKFASLLDQLVVVVSIYALISHRGISRLFIILASFISLVMTNIDGSRGGFITPLIIGLFSLMFSSQISADSKIARTISAFRKTKVSKKSISLLVSICIAGIAFMCAGVFLTYLRIVPSNSAVSIELYNQIIMSVFFRICGAPFSTGVWNIEAFKSLQLPLSYWLGGFPGSSLLFGDHPPLFMLTGSYYSTNYLLQDLFSTNLNSSGLFLNVSFYGLALGSMLFLAFMLFNSLLFGPFLRSTIKLAGVNFYCRPLLYDIIRCAFFSTLALNIISSVIAVFPMDWFLYILVVFAVPLFGLHKSEDSHSL